MSTESTTFDHIATVDLHVAEYAPGNHFVRIHPTGHEPLWFGPRAGDSPAGRFDAPSGEYRVLYTGENLEAALVETLIRNTTVLLLDFADLDVRSAAVIECTRKVRLAELHGRALRRLQIEAGLVHGPYRPCRELARAIWQHDAQVDGLAFRSNRNNDLVCHALFDRARDALTVIDDAPLSSDLSALMAVLDAYGVGIA
jgi:hypothetical protein